MAEEIKPLPCTLFCLLVNTNVSNENSLAVYMHFKIVVFCFHMEFVMHITISSTITL